MRRLQNAGYELVVVTNQSGLVRGYYTEAQYQALTEQMKAALANAGVKFDDVYHCPHPPKDGSRNLSTTAIAASPPEGQSCVPLRN